MGLELGSMHDLDQGLEFVLHLRYHDGLGGHDWEWKIHTDIDFDLERRDRDTNEADCVLV